MINVGLTFNKKFVRNMLKLISLNKLNIKRKSINVKLSQNEWRIKLLLNFNFPHNKSIITLVK